MFPDLFVSWPMARIQKDEAAALSHEQVERDRTKILGYYNYVYPWYQLSPKLSHHGPKEETK